MVKRKKEKKQTLCIRDKLKQTKVLLEALALMLFLSLESQPCRLILIDYTPSALTVTPRRLIPKQVNFRLQKHSTNSSNLQFIQVHTESWFHFLY
jgi:hypothetical protein